MKEVNNVEVPRTVFWLSENAGRFASVSFVQAVSVPVSTMMALNGSARKMTKEVLCSDDAVLFDLSGVPPSLIFLPLFGGPTS
jgi:hypothetical protein